tara:strand:- start:4900 stop:5406 length:507 start_codon:yes stop_codon:yes gene_type:complete
MINLILITTLLAAAPIPDITYQVSTDELFEYTTYSFHGKKILNSPQYNVYVLDNIACELKNTGTIFNESLVLKNKKIRKKFFSLEKDYLEDICYLTVKNHPYDKMFNYNYEFDYWYPEYNTIIVRSSTKANTRKTNYNKRNRSKRRFEYKPKKVLVYHMPTKKIHHKK